MDTLCEACCKGCCACFNLCATSTALYSCNGYNCCRAVPPGRESKDSHGKYAPISKIAEIPKNTEMPKITEMSRKPLKF